MLFDIHTAMQDANNLDLTFCMAVKNHMFTNAIFEITFANVIACTANIWLVCQIMKSTVKLRQIAYLLSLSPLLASITANGKQVVPGFLRKDERSHLVFTFQLIQNILQRIIGGATLFTLDQSMTERFQLRLALFE